MRDGPLLKDIFSETLRISEDQMYQHRTLLMTGDVESGTALLGDYVQKAHEDTRNHLRKLANISLDPLGDITLVDPAMGYPELLPLQTLKGYFGEVFAGLVAEHFSPMGIKQWRVPAFLFRFHDLAFDRLERLRHSGGSSEVNIIGRHGDDCLAFQMDASGEITCSLACEAKCTASHDAGLLMDAHKKISEANLVPVSVRQVIEVLMDRDDDADTLKWVRALQHLWLKAPRTGYERFDLVCYVCGQRPKYEASWLLQRPRLI